MHQVMGPNIFSALTSFNKLNIFFFRPAEEKLDFVPRVRPGSGGKNGKVPGPGITVPWKYLAFVLLRWFLDCFQWRHRKALQRVALHPAGSRKKKIGVLFFFSNLIINFLLCKSNSNSMFKNRFNFNCACFLYIKLKFNILYRFYHTFLSFFQQLYLDDVFVTGILREKLRLKLRAISKMRSVFCHAVGDHRKVEQMWRMRYHRTQQRFRFQSLKCPVEEKSFENNI